MKKNNKKGFTLAELLVVVAIIGVLAAISIPVFGSAVGKAEHAANVANVRAAYAEALVNAMNSDDYTGGEVKISESVFATFNVDGKCEVDCTDDNTIVVQTDGKYTEEIPVDDDVVFVDAKVD